MSMWPVTSCSEVLIWNYIERCKKHSVSLEIRIKTEKIGCFYEPRQAQRMRILCGKGAGAAHTPVLWEVGRKCCRTCDMERQWKLSELCLLSPACELQHVVLPCLLKPQVPRACLHWALPGLHPRQECEARSDALARAEHSHSPACCHLPLVAISLPHCGQGKVKISLWMLSKLGITILLASYVSVTPVPQSGFTFFPSTLV